MAGRSKEEIAALLTQSQPQFQQMDQKYNAATFKWQNEIAMLERRVHDCYEDVDLGNGDKIAVRTALSEEEMQEYGTIEQRKAELEKQDPELSRLTYRQIELMTANPLITAEWLEENKDRWPVNDALTIMQAFLEGIMSRRMNRVGDLKSFRTE